jgi:hypothetical protein
MALIKMRLLQHSYSVLYKYPASTRDHYNLGPMRPTFANNIGGFHPIHVWHLNIHEYNRIGFSLHSLDNFHTIARYIWKNAQLLEHNRYRFLAKGVIISY